MFIYLLSEFGSANLFANGCKTRNLTKSKIYINQIYIKMHILPYMATYVTVGIFF